MNGELCIIFPVSLINRLDYGDIQYIYTQFHRISALNLQESRMNIWGNHGCADKNIKGAICDDCKVNVLARFYEIDVIIFCPVSQVQRNQFMLLRLVMRDC